jgi:hypothetical protein
MRKLELDDQGKLNIGPVGGAKTGAINVAFASNDNDGIAMNVEATPAAGSAKAAIKLGAFTIGQDVAAADASTFGIADSTGASIFNPAKSQAALALAVTSVVPSLWHVWPNTTLDGLATLDTGAGKSQTLCNARANLLKASAAVHSASVAAYNASGGAHNLADTVNAPTLAAVPDATNLATSITLCTALAAWAVGHFGQTAVHYWDDATTSTTVTDDTPADLAAVALCLNELTAMFQAHYLGNPTLV